MRTSTSETLVFKIKWRTLAAALHGLKMTTAHYTLCDRLRTSLWGGDGGVSGCTRDRMCRRHMAIDFATYKVGTKHARFLPDQARDQSSSAMPRHVLGDLHEE